MSLLSVRNLAIHFPTDDGVVKAVDGIDFDVKVGEVLAIVGESGSGKTVTNLGLMGLLAEGSATISGSAIFNKDGKSVDLLQLSPDELRKYRGSEIAMIFQDPMSALHPFYSIGDQLIEAHQIHNDVSKKVSRDRAVELLEKVGISDGRARLKSYPHQFSGGMRQRVLIAMALINNPSILIADEPTTALDVTVQAQILKLLKDLQEEFKMAIVLITHDLGVVAGTADHVQVMYAGKIVESAPVETLFSNPQMPYTVGLLASIPRIDQPHRDRLTAIPGQPPSMVALPPGCSFAPRCSRKQEVANNLCEVEMPALVAHEAGHLSRCHLELTVRAGS